MAVMTGALVPLFTGTASAVQFCNTTPIVFTPPPQPTQAVQALAPYPSQITVSGQTGTITDVNVILNDLTYEVPDDLDIMLVAPDGTRIMVMSDAGGANFTAFPVTDIDLTFDDAAANQPSADGQLVAGTFRPIDDDDDPDEFDAADTFLSPAPATPSVATLSTFNGLNPNGTWSLYVVDDNPGPPVVMDIGGGWCLDILTTGGGTTTSTTTAPTTTSTTTAPTTTSTTTAPTTTSTTTAPTTTSTTTAPTTTTTTVPPTTTTTVPPTTTTTTTTTTIPPTTTTTTVPPTTTTSTAPTTTTSTTVPPGTTCDGRAATIVGTDGPDRLVGTPGPDVIVALGGDDLVVGMGGDDVICGGPGNDSLQGGDGNDRLFGEGGDDQCVGGPGVDFAATCEATYEVP
jgi:hypothetical protein